MILGRLQCHAFDVETDARCVRTATHLVTLHVNECETGGELCDAHTTEAEVYKDLRDPIFECPGGLPLMSYLVSIVPLAAE